MNPLSLYGLGYVDPRLQSDSEDYTTGNVLAAMPRAQGWDRDEILPFAREVGGRQVGANPQGWGSSGDVFRHLDQKAGNNWKLAAPGMLYNALAAGAEVGNAPLMGGYPMGAESREHMTDAAGAVVGPQVATGFMRAAMAPRGGSELGTFGGRLAAKNLAAQGIHGPQKVLDMLPIWEAQGKTPQEIWALGAKELEGTPYAGPARGVDKQPKFEISDHRFDTVANDGARSIGDFATHKYLFDAYPDLTETKFIPGKWGGGAHTSARKPQNASIEAHPLDKSTLLHEMQHGVQGREGFAKGSSLESEAVRELYPGVGGALRYKFDQLRHLGKPFDVKLQGDAASNVLRRYKNSAGEAEARTVESRMDMGPAERRATYPVPDVQEGQQIVRGAGKATVGHQSQSFGGRLAKTADHQKLAAAEKMDAAGVPREQIWNDTGWFKGSDGKWRFEIDDSKAAMNYGRDKHGTNSLLGMEGKLGDIFTHPDAYAAYPDLSNIKGDIGSLRNGTYYTPPTVGPEKITVNATRNNRAPYTLHEMQHAIQTREGFTPGTGIASIEAELKGKVPDNWLRGDVLREVYNRTSGEVEARAVEARQKLTPDQRKALPPWKSYDVPEDQHIVRNSAGTQMSEPPGIRAYHGSPHDFDRFDLSKIGTGEGAQAYGHGLYFAENEGVAKGYRDKLSANSPATVGNSMGAQLLAKHGGDANAAIEYIKAIRNWQNNQSMKDAVAYLQGVGAKPAGRMYEVSIKADPEHFLDWDKPFSQQPEPVRNVLQSQTFKGIGRPWDGSHGAAWNDINHNVSGLDMFPDVVRWLRTKEGAAALREVGVPGVKYLDQGSRGAGEGSRNYAVWDDQLISILRKYGLMPAAVGAAAYGTSDPASAAPRQ